MVGQGKEHKCTSDAVLPLLLLFLKIDGNDEGGVFFFDALGFFCLDAIFHAC
jgi:hypothetical protein